MIVSKIGIHSIGDKRNGYGPFLQTIADAGRQLSLVKCRDDFGAVDEPLKLWPDTLCIGSFTEFDRFPFNFDAFKKRALLNPKIKIWEVLNEEDAPSTYHAKTDLYISLASSFAAQGWSLCMFNCSSGTPPHPSEDGGESYAEIACACKWMKDNDYPAYLGLHEYYHPDKPTIGHYKQLADYLQARDALIPIAITEWGWETCEDSPKKYLEWAKATDRVYMNDDRVKGLAMWSLGGRGWQASNYATILPQLGEYIATVQPATPEPPAPPPEPPTHEARIAALESRVTAIEARL